MMTEEIKRGSFEWFARWCRTNTGRHFLDSGDYYGRQYDRPVADDKTPVIKCEIDCGWLPESSVPAEQIARLGLEVRDIERYGRGGMQIVPSVFLTTCADYMPGDTVMAQVTIATERFFETHLESDDTAEKLQRLWRAWQDKYKDGYAGDTDDIGTFLDWLRARGVKSNYVKTRGDNTYNSDNDLSQNFVFTLFAFTNDPHADIWHRDDVYVAIAPHTGCDIRGGYPSLQIFRVVDPCYFANWQVEFWANTYDKWGKEFDWDSPYRFDEDPNTRWIMTDKGPEPQVCHKGEWAEVWYRNDAEGF